MLRLKHAMRAFYLYNGTDPPYPRNLLALPMPTAQIHSAATRLEPICSAVPTPLSLFDMLSRASSRLGRPSPLRTLAAMLLNIALLASVIAPAAADARSRDKSTAHVSRRAIPSVVPRGASTRETPRYIGSRQRQAPVPVPSGPLPAPVMAALQHAGVPTSSISVVVQRIDRPAPPLLAWNSNQAMMPASTMKLVTTWSGLSILGPDYTWLTLAYADGTVQDGVLHGNLYIEGSGDPKLVPEQLIDLVQRIHQAGIQSIQGDLILDKRAFDASTRDLPAFDSDVDAPYNVGPDPLLYSFKSLSIAVTPSPNGPPNIDVQPALAQLQIENEIRPVAGPCRGNMQAVTPVFSPAQNGIIDAVFSGPYASRCGEHDLNTAMTMSHSEFFGGGFLALWHATGGQFSGAIRDGATPVSARLVATHRSPPLSEIVGDINKFSNNVMARNLFLTIGEATTRGPATPQNSAAAIHTFLQRSRLPMPELALENGSGLSRDEHVSAASLASLLEAANASPVAQVFTSSLPIVGVDGTMRHRLTNSPIVGNAHIKTGTLNDVRAIAGYVGTGTGAVYVVVSLINDPRSSQARAAHDALLDWVYHLPE
jgi:D-alanyl-D-alanine carboxypeptidase/D-alanyl-D-alanine-endopeptidase (penicillin-binding protein 4)